MHAKDNIKMHASTCVFSVLLQADPGKSKLNRQPHEPERVD